MRYVLAVVTAVIQIIVTDGAVNYCGAKMCGHSNDHTFCKYRPGPSSSCAGYMEGQLSTEEKERVLARLNRRRSEVALGWRHWPPAGDMLKLRWIEELSREAQRWADQCRPPRAPEERDVCRDLYSISVGQCVASIVGEAPGLRPETMVDMWFMQRMLYDGNVTSYIPSRAKNFYGDFAQMMWSRTYLVGCGRSRFMAEWRGRLRSVERLVCNFAPRGPVPFRPLWTPADPASLCPRRSNPDILPNLCTYQQKVGDSRNFNDSVSVQDNFLLDTVFEIEMNASLDFLGSLDELYLTKIAIATIRTTMPVIPLYYSFQKRDVFEQSEKADELWKVGNKSEVEQSVVNHQLNPVLVAEQKPSTELRIKSSKTKMNLIGRPKPYDMNELNVAIREQKTNNINDNQDLRNNKEIDLYGDYSFVETEEDTINATTKMGVFTQSIYNESTTHKEANLETHEFIEITNRTDGMARSEDAFTKFNEEINGSLFNNKIVEDYLSDPETVQALQNALEQMERTLASPVPVSTPGKVRRELRNLEADLQGQVTTEIVSEMKTHEAIKDEDRNKSRGPMLSMVLKYLPYLKPYEKSIVGDTRNTCDAFCYDVSVIIYSFLLHTFIF